MTNNGFYRIRNWAAAGCLLGTTVTAISSPAPVFGENMVLQRDMPVPIWGVAKPGAPVKLAFAGQERTTTADEKGNWSVQLDPMPANSTGRDMIVDDGSQVVIGNILVGEVWVCSGQSNMAYTVKQSADSEKEIAGAKFPEIRLLGNNDLGGKWKICSPETVGDFSAVAYAFARDLQAEFKVPIGLLSFSIGGTNATRWIPRETLKADESLWKASLAPVAAAYVREQQKKIADAAKAAASGATPATEPTPTPDPKKAWDDFVLSRVGGLYERFINRVKPYAIRGVLWYQGEANSNNPDLHAKLFPLLIKTWREAWGNDELPFLFVQLPNYDTPVGNKWVRLRETQEEALSLPKTGMVVTVDIGESADLHPKNKRDVGKRAALIARKDVYGQDIVASGPVYKSSSVEDGKIRLVFEQTASALRLIDPATGFLIAGADENFVPATAKIDGNTLLVWSDSVKEPVAVRYAWMADPKTSLFNDAGLPARPFRTDNWAYPYKGPIYQSFAVEGGKIRLKFEPSPLTLKLGDRASRDFRIAGADRKFAPAKVAIDGTDILVWSDEVAEPVAVRYAWGNDEKEVSLFDSADQSAQAFRTDDWSPESL